MTDAEHTQALHNSWRCSVCGGAGHETQQGMPREPAPHLRQRITDAAEDAWDFALAALDRWSSGDWFRRSRW